MQAEKCFQMTVEGPGEMFQVVRDALDTFRLIKSGVFLPAGESSANSFNDQTQIQRLVGQFNLEKAQEVSQKLKITVSQASRIFDLYLLYLTNNSDDKMLTAFKGYYKRKLARQNQKKLIVKTPKKHIEFLGEMQPVNPDDFKSISDEKCKFS